MTKEIPINIKSLATETVSSIYNVSAIMEQQILFARGRILCRIKYCRWTRHSSMIQRNH